MSLTRKFQRRWHREHGRVSWSWMMFLRRQAISKRLRRTHRLVPGVGWERK